jgi:hypothetical protein
MVQAIELLVAQGQQLVNAQQLAHQRYLTLEQLVSTQLTCKGLGAALMPDTQSPAASDSAATRSRPAARPAPALEPIVMVAEEAEIGELSDAEADELCELAEQQPPAAGSASLTSADHSVTGCHHRIGGSPASSGARWQGPHQSRSRGCSTTGNG